MTDDGTVYSVTVSNGSGSATSAGATLTVQAVPLITSGPEPTVSVCYGDPAVFSVTAEGSGTLYYQWQTNGVNLMDGGNVLNSSTPTLNLTTTSASDAGNYTVVITNAYGSVTSSVAVLTVNPLPTVSVNSDTICVGGSSLLTATTGASSPTYLWSPGGETTPTITVSPVSTTIYTVLVTDGTTGCTNSASGTVTVNPLPTVGVNSAAICVGDSVLLTATTSASSPTYLWSPGGATTPSISVSPGSTTIYTVLVTDGVTGCTNSASGTVTVNPLPNCTIITNAALACPSHDNTASVASAGVGAHYGWTVTGNGTYTAGQDTSTVTYTAAASGVVHVCVTVTNANGCICSSCLDIPIGTPLTINTQPLPHTNNVSTPVSFTVAASGGAGTITYQWQKAGANMAVDGSRIPTVTAATLNITDVYNSDAGTNANGYSCVVSSDCGSVTSSVVTLAVKPVTTSPSVVITNAPMKANLSNAPVIMGTATPGATLQVVSVQYAYLSPTTGAWTDWADATLSSAGTVSNWMTAGLTGLQLGPVKFAVKAQNSAGNSKAITNLYNYVAWSHITLTQNGNGAVIGTASCPNGKISETFGTSNSLQTITADLALPGTYTLATKAAPGYLLFELRDHGGLRI